MIPRFARDDKLSLHVRRKAAYPSHTASAIRAATGTHKPHRKPRNAREELLNIA